MILPVLPVMEQGLFLLEGKGLLKQFRGLLQIRVTLMEGGGAKANWAGVVSTGEHVRPEKKAKKEHGFVRLLKNDDYKILREYDEENNAVFSEVFNIDWIVKKEKR